MTKLDTKLIKKTKDGYSFTIERPYRAAFGFGEKFDSVNQKGKLVRACVRERCFYQADYTYLSMPFFLTPDGFGVYVDTYVEVDFDFRTEGKITVTFPVGSKGEKADVYMYEGTPKEIIGQFRAQAGMPRVFPKWVLGAWMSSNRWHTQDEIEEQLELNKKHNFPHSVMVIEPWSDCTTHFLWRHSEVPPFEGDGRPCYDDMSFPEGDLWRDPKKMIETIHDDGIKLILWIVPVYEQGKTCWQTESHKEQCLHINDYVREHRDCVMNADGTPYEIPHTWCIGDMVPDFTNPDAKEHWFNHFAYLKDIGVDGFKTDGGEFIHDHTVSFHDGTTGLEGQNAYCEQYTRAFAEFIGENGIVFTRSGGPKTPTFGVVWAGDQESVWSEFASVLKAGLSAGLSGVNCWGYDIAGFSGYLPTEELYLRAVQTAAFVPVMQWHSDPVSNDRCDFTRAWKCNDRSPWNISAFHKNEKLLDLLRDQFRLHYNILPYQYNLMRESAETGVSPMRHLVTEFPTDERVFGIDDQFMLGDALMVVPILEDYVETRKFYLPEGAWYDFFTGEKLFGGEHEVKIVKEHSPVYMRENTCVPLNLSGGKLCSDVGNGLDGYTELTFMISGKGRYVFTDDLGNRIVLRWDEKQCVEEENALGTKYKTLRVGKK